MGDSAALMFVDSHCHLDFAAFDSDRDRVVARSRAAGVSQFVIPGVAVGQWQRCADLCASTSGIYFAAGIHPWWLGESAPQDQWQDRVLPTLEFMLARPACVAVGECGLDAAIDTPMALQLQALDWHLALAREHCLPVILHCVKAHNPMLAALSRHPGVRGVVHAFSGSPELARQYWQKGFYLGVGGVVTYPRAQKTRRALATVGSEALLLETDAPDMPLSGQQGMRNSPEQLPLVAAELAQLRSQTVEDIAVRTSANAAELFGFGL